jgi:hypothetical protein
LAEQRFGLGPLSLLHVNFGQQKISVHEAGPSREKILQSRGGIVKVSPLFQVE